MKAIVTVFRDLSKPPDTLNSSAAYTIIEALHRLIDADSSFTVSSCLDLRKSPNVAEAVVETTLSLEKLSDPEYLNGIEKRESCQLVVQEYRARPKQIKLAVFDMDSTLIQQEVIELLAAHTGFEAEVAEVTTRAMNGELDFAQSLRERVSLLKGVPVSVFDDLKSRISYTPGTPKLIKCLRSLGVKTAVLSGGFIQLATHISRDLLLDHTHANDLAVENGFLTGKLTPGCIIVDGRRKADLLRQIASTEAVADSKDILAVGDGANDLLMMREAGVGLAVNAKPRVQKLAPHKLNCSDMSDIMYILGYTSDDIEQMVQ